MIRSDDGASQSTALTPPSARLGVLLEREDAGHRGAAADRGIERHRAAVQLDERAHDRQAEAGAAVARAVRMGLEPVEHLSCTSGGMPGPWSVTENTTASGRRSAASVTVAPGGEKPTALASRLNSTCRTRRSSADEAADVGGGADVERDVVLDQPVLHAFGGGLHGPADIDRAEIELHRAGVDGGEIEDVVDDGEQRVGRGVDVAEIFALLAR